MNKLKKDKKHIDTIANFVFVIGIAALAVTILQLTGCTHLFASEPSIGDTTSKAITGVISTGSSFSVLPLVGGVSCAGGVVLLFISQGRRGWLPLIVGIGLVILNSFIYAYMHMIAIPVIVMSGSIGLAWTWKIVEKLIWDDENNG